MMLTNASRWDIGEEEGWVLIDVYAWIGGQIGMQSQIYYIIVWWIQEFIYYDFISSVNYNFCLEQLNVFTFFKCYTKISQQKFP